MRSNKKKAGSKNASKSNAAKGRVLEKFVRIFQEIIIKSDPRLKTADCSVETNKILVVNGVRHEIDVLVTMFAKSAYESTWIFECKNRGKSVSKNDVIVLSEKVRALSATRGCLIAKSFSASAEAQARQDPRLRLVPCTEEFESVLNNFELTLAAHEFTSVQVRVKERGVAPRADLRVHDLTGTDTICYLKKVPLIFNAMIIDHADTLVLAERNANQARYRLEGTHSGRCVMRQSFGPGELLINDLDVEHMELDVHFNVRSQRLRILSKFEVKGQGRAISFEAVEDAFPGSKIEVTLIERLENTQFSPR
jgi:hypothetical protein